MSAKVRINRRRVPIVDPIENVELTYHTEEDRFLVLKQGANAQFPYLLEAHASPYMTALGGTWYCRYDTERLSEFAHAILEFIGEE